MDERTRRPLEPAGRASEPARRPQEGMKKRKRKCFPKSGGTIGHRLVRIAFQKAIRYKTAFKGGSADRP